MTTAIILIALVSWFTVSPLIAVTFGQMIRSADVTEVATIDRRREERDAED